VRLLSAHQDELMRLSDALLEHEDLDRVEIVACLSGVAETPRAQPSRQPRLVVVPPSRPAPPHSSSTPRRGERVRARLAAALLRERPAPAPAHATDAS
jgi:hypothetical protein